MCIPDVLKSDFVEAGLKVKVCIKCWAKIKIAQALSLLNTMCLCVSLRERLREREGKKEGAGTFAWACRFQIAL